MDPSITIEGTEVGPGEPLFIIAECGVTCQYDLEVTRDLIDVVAESGAQAIKFIFWFPDEIMSDRSRVYTYETREGEESRNMYEMLQDLRFSLDEWKEVKAYADDRDVVMLCTVNSPGGIKYAEELGLEAYKLSSWDYNHHPLWDEIAALGKPMLIDTGPVKTVDVAKVMDLMVDHDNQQSVLLHCFHTDNPGEMNMRSIPYLRDTFNTLVGYSSKDYRDETDITAVTLGSVVLEKRLTLSRDMDGHHHVLSKEPREFDDYVTTMRDVRASLGSRELAPSPADMEGRKKWFRRITADRDIPEGTVLTRDMLAGKRPADGVSPEFMDLFVGRTAKRDIRANEALSWDDV